ncbi:DUF6296 family protein, partial [Kitasatospora camelliae]|uniref:DUF6296 family protein n=1 Tax=Kitasatospora camelliae TaxID=3156397 RepID=UPI00339CF76E
MPTQSPAPPAGGKPSGPPPRFAVTLPRTPGRHAPPEVVIVHATGERAADGTPVYADSHGTFRVASIGT